MEVICLETVAFHKLVDEVFDRVKATMNKPQDKWISGEEAMKMLRVSSKTTLQKLRDEGKIRFSQPERKIILYETESILKYLNDNAKDTF